MNDTQVSGPRLRLYRLSFAALVLGGWYAFSLTSSINILAPPHEIVAKLLQSLLDGEVWTYLKPTGTILLTGSAIAIVIGVPTGIVIGRFWSLNRLTDAAIYTLYLTPKVALVPFMLVALGYGTSTKVMIVVISGIFPIIISTAAGVRSVDKDQLELARSYCSSELETWRDVVIPSARPLIITGLRLGLSHALTGAVVADFFAGATGFGYLIILYSNRFDGAGALYPVVILGALGFAVVSGLQWVERRTSPWAQL